MGTILIVVTKSTRDSDLIMDKLNNKLNDKKSYSYLN